MKKVIAFFLTAMLAFMPASFAVNSKNSCFESDAIAVLNMNGTDASTTFTDAAGKRTFTASGGAQIDTAQSKFGGASGLFDGSGDYVRDSTDSADFDFGTGDYTIDFFYRVPAAPTSDYIVEVGRGGGGGSGKGVAVVGASGTSIIVYHNGTGIKTETWSISNDTWYYIRVIRVSGVVHIYKNGVELGSGTTANGDLSGSTEGIAFGGSPLSAGFSTNGWIDDVRVIKGYAVPNEATPTSEQITPCPLGGVLCVSTTE